MSAVLAVRPGWLVDPKGRQVEIYRLAHAVEVRSLPAQLLGEPVLPAFLLEIS